MLLEQVCKSLVRQLLECRHPIAPKLRELVERVILEGDQFAQGETTPDVELISE